MSTSVAFTEHNRILPNFSMPSSKLAERVKLPNRLPKPKGVHHSQLLLTFKQVENVFAFRIRNVKRDVATNRVSIIADVDKDIFIIFTLICKIVDRDYLQVDEVLVGVNTHKDNAQSDFIISSLIALLTLCGPMHLNIPILKFDATLNFQIPIKEISHVLQRRHTAYLLMAIEQSIGVKFILPKQEYTSKDIENIHFIYKAIALKTFWWPTETFSMIVPVSHFDIVKKFIANIEQDDYKVIDYFPDPMVCEKQLLGYVINLGYEQTRIEKMVLLKPEEVKGNLHNPNCDSFVMSFMVTTGRIEYHFLNSAELKVPLEPIIQHFIRLGNIFEKLVLDAYHSKAALTLGSLSDEEKQLILEPDNEI